MTSSPNALQRTAPCVTLPASAAAMHGPRQPLPMQGLGSMSGVLAALP